MGQRFSRHDQTPNGATKGTPGISHQQMQEDELKTLRQILRAARKVCELKPPQIESLCQSIGRASSPTGPDSGLALHLRGFVIAIKATEAHLRAHRHANLSSNTSTMKVKELRDHIGQLAVDIEYWHKHFSALVFPEVMPDRRKSPSRLKEEARLLADRCYNLCDMMESFCSMISSNNIARSPTTSSPTYARSRGTRTPSSMIGGQYDLRGPFTSFQTSSSSRFSLGGHSGRVGVGGASDARAYTTIGP